MPKIRLAAVPLAALLILAQAPDAPALRILTYNILNYSAGRENLFRDILEEIQPDVVVVQEVLGQSAVDRFRDQVLNQVNPGEWAATPFVDGTDTDNAAYYRTAKCSFVSHFVIGTALRDIDEYTFRTAPHTSSAADVRIYVLHLKASQGIENEQKREAEVTQMRNRMETFPVGGNYLVAGDFNIYRALEPAYIHMTNPANGLAGVVEDPIDSEGNWHNNSSFASVHTQSPRTTQFGGGANGGLDDRFDMILTGPSLLDGEGFDILESTYEAYGQDGLHFDGALNEPPYVVVDSTMAQTLHDASDHLPVFADFQLHPLLVTDASLDVGAVIVGGTGSADLPVGNGSPEPADELDYSFAAPAGFTAPAGPFTAEAGAGPSFHAIDLDGATVGAKAGNLIVTTDDPDHPAEPVPVTGTVLDHASPSTEAGSVVLVASVDLGAVAAGDTAFTEVEAHNQGFGPLQALLEVYAAQLTGAPGFFLEGGFAPATVGGSPASWTVGFDAVGASDGDYLGTLTLSTRDQQDLNGAVTLSDLTYDLAVTVGAVGVDPGPVGVATTGFSAVAPNPFRPSTEIRFGVRTGGPVTLRVYDVQGRIVRTLVDEPLGAGTHVTVWDGRDARGASLAPGIYFARLRAGRDVDTHKLVRVR